MTKLKKLRVPLFSGLAGGAVVAAVLAASGATGGDTTTVVQQSPLSQPAAARSGTGLTAREIYRRVAPGVVNVRATVVQRVETPFGFPQENRGQATGSGFVVGDDGTILTNAHVVEGASSVRVQFEDSKTAEAKIIGSDPSIDLAVLKVDPDGLELEPLELGSSKSVVVGDPTVAIGNPFGLDRTLTTGVVSALQRKIEAPNGFAITDVIQTDAAINPGNSGGPLLDAAGRVIGITSQIATAGGAGGNVGIGFAVPVDTIESVLPELRSDGKVERAYLGVSTLTIDASLERLGLSSRSGALVQTVERGSPAAKAGIRPGDATSELDGQKITLGGDVIVAIDGKAVKTSIDVQRAISAKKPGDEVSVKLRRGSDEKTVKVKLGDRPARATP